MKFLNLSGFAGEIGRPKNKQGHTMGLHLDVKVWVGCESVVETSYISAWRSLGGVKGEIKD